jgi:DNA uptake protein ComE-like DNA-binding protein
MTFAAALALLAGSALAGAATTPDAKPTPAAAGTAAPDKAPSAKPPAAKQKQVNLNAATAKELKALPGGSDEEAARIIAGRPYNSKAFLVTNKVISEARYVEIKSLVVAGEPAKAAAPKK